MAGNRSPKYFTVVIHKHGILWWLVFGWWWRPIKLIFWGALSALCGFRQVRIEKRY